MDDTVKPDLTALQARIDDLEHVVAELREELTETVIANEHKVMLLPGLVVYYPEDDHGNVIVVAANSRRLPILAIPARPTVREWAGVLQHLEKWPHDVADRAENLMLRVIDPHLADVPIDLLDKATIEQAVAAARFTDNERTTVRELLAFAVTEAAAKSKAPAL